MPILFSAVDQFNKWVESNQRSSRRYRRGRQSGHSAGYMLHPTLVLFRRTAPNDGRHDTVVIEAELEGSSKTISVRSYMSRAVTMSGLAMVYVFVPEYMG